MCGLIGVVSSDSLAPVKALKALELLEYRGYDSAGIATIENDKIVSCKAVGKIAELKNKFSAKEFKGNVAIAHTRWATHGKPTLNNTHPHIYKNIAVVHNGIIENHLDIRQELEEEGYKFASETDTEVIPILIGRNIEKGMPEDEAVKSAISKLKGSYALAIIVNHESAQSKVYATCFNIPLIIGKNADDKYLSSDLMAIVNNIEHYYRIESGELLILAGSEEALVSLNDNSPLELLFTDVKHEEHEVSKGEFEHYMLKEIHEQPLVFQRLIEKYYNAKSKEIEFDECDIDFSYYEKIEIIACGTSYNAGIAARYMMEEVARVPCEVHLASEFRYREVVFNDDSLYLFISQSGETADVLQSHQFCQENGCTTFALVNNTNSTLAVNADCCLDIMAGTEIGVASTKAFSAQLLLLLFISYKISGINGYEPKIKLKDVIANIEKSFLYIQKLLQSEKIKEICKNFTNSSNAFYLGRGISYGLALEGSLKFKELTYIHSEGMAAGELKHGPLALVDKNMFIIMIAPTDRHHEKIMSNLQEISARDGKVILIAPEDVAKKYSNLIFDYIDIPFYDDYSVSMLNIFPLQLLSYYTAKFLGNDVDQPRNLAKSVTVE